MQFQTLERLVSPVQPNVTVVRLRASNGLTGLEGTTYGASAVQTHLRDVVAPRLLALADASPEPVAAATQSTSVISVRVWRPAPDRRLLSPAQLRDHPADHLKSVITPSRSTMGDDRQSADAAAGRHTV